MELTAEKRTARLRGGIAAGHGRLGPATDPLLTLPRK